MKLSLAHHKFSLYCFSSVCYTVFYLLCTKTSAQIIPDGTLPNNTAVAPNGTIVEITAGTTAGNNLFHSFEQFSIPTNNTAFFNNANAIENIISRVTGNAISDLDGLIRANGEANLFLINPNGIVFGENSALDLGGSFIGTTADSLHFADGQEFSAVSADTPPLLTVSIPIGLQFGNDSGNITVKGTGHNAFFDFDTFTVDRFERVPGLEVFPGNTLGLIGNNIILDGGNLTAGAGNIELGSVSEAAEVDLIANDLGWTFNYEKLGAGDINLANMASIDVSGNGSGNIQIQGNNVNITDGSAILAETEGNATGGLTSIQANNVNIIGTDPDLFLPSSIWSDVYLDATGDGGSVLIETGNLLLKNGGEVNVNTFSLGNGGSLTVKARDIKAIGESEFGDFISGLFAQADIFFTGKAGDILLETDSLLVSQGAQINTTTFGAGDAGNLSIQAKDIKLIGASEFTSSGLFTSTEAEGQGGSLTIDTDLLEVRDGAQVAASTLGSGDAGNLAIQANKLKLVSSADSSFFTGLFTSTEAEGQGGNLNLATNSLEVLNGAQINTTTFGAGDAGNLSIKAEDANLIGSSEFVSSGIFASVEAEGKGGSVNLETNLLEVVDGAKITTSTIGEGDAGNLSIEAKTIGLRGTSASGLPSGLVSRVKKDALGNGGSISVVAEQLKIDRGGQISASTFDVGNGGDISVAVEQLKIDQGGQISASTFDAGNAGFLNIEASNIEINGTGELGSSGLFSNAIKGNGNGGDIILKSDRLTMANGATINVGNFQSRGLEEPGTGQTGKIDIQANNLELNNSTSELPSSITASTNNLDGGNINLSIAQDIAINGNSELSSETRGAGNGGNIEINANNLNLNNQGQVTVNSNSLGKAGNIKITTGDRINANRGLITANSERSGGGDITLKTNFMDLKNSSQISTSVFNGTGGGGNITIDSDYVIGRNNSDIRANAFGGDGGNININADVIFLSADSEVDASSQFGLDGVVEINNPDTDRQISVQDLPEKIVDPSALITAVCPIKQGESLVTTGKGGLAENPRQNIRGESLWEDLRDYTDVLSPAEVAVSSNNSPIVEAQAWNINEQGTVELLSYIPQENNQDEGKMFNQCKR